MSTTKTDPAIEWASRFSKVSTTRDLTYKTSLTTKRAFSSEADRNPELQKAIVTHASAVSEWPSFTREMFGRLYRPDDVDNAIEKPEAWARHATMALEAQPDFPELRALSRSHRALAGEATTKLANAVAGALGLDKMTKDNAASRDPAETEKRVRNLARLVQAQAEAGDLEAATDTKALAKVTGNEWAQSLTRRQQLDGNAQSMPTGKMGEAVTATLKAVKETAEAIALLSGLMRGAGVDDGSGEYDAGELPMFLVEMIKKNGLMKSVLAMLGKMKEARTTAATTPINGGRLDVVGIELGGDPLRLVGSEVAMLGRADTRVDILRRVVDKTALVRAQVGEKQADRGDFVLLVDRSGSMGGQRIITARALATMMILDAVRDRRRVILVMFDHVARPAVVVERGGRGLGRVLAELMLEPSGGTDAVGAMKQARAKLSKSERERVDTVIVSDGDWSDGSYVGTNTNSVVERTPATEDLRRGGGKFHEVRIVDGRTQGDEARLLAEHAWLDSLTVAVAGDVSGALSMATKVRRR